MHPHGFIRTLLLLGTSMLCRTSPGSPATAAAVLLLVTGLAACGGGGGDSSNAPPPTYSIGGAVSGLGSARSVVLQANGGDNLAVNANGAFSFVTRIASGSAYAVTVLTQPTGEICTVTGGSGTMPAKNVDSVAVSCTNVWTWVSGADVQGALGVYGTLGTGSTANVPGARSNAISWIDSAGNLWLFGGDGYDYFGTQGPLNDLWKYTPANQQWTWVSGANTTNASGVYGTLGTGSTANVPGGRMGAVSWTDSAGNLWLFGGWHESTGGIANDLWKYTPSNQQWTWVSGANTPYASGVYGTLGTGSTANVPGARSNAISWIDSAGNLWLFGGDGFDSTGTQGFLNDLWKYTPANQQWTWVSGANVQGASGVYGTLGTGSTANVPGARLGAISWTDSAGNLWLFGGQGHPVSARGNGWLNDLWKYTPSNQQWTWVSGANTPDASGVYGTLGTGSTANVPGGRAVGISWIDSAGNLWLFGGDGDGSTGASSYLSLNDLWRY